MFKFIRRYQKWLLVVFCAMLMFAFLVQPVMSIFFPDPSKRTIGTLFDGEKIKENEKQQAVQSVAMLKRLGFVGIGLFPVEESEADAALAWLLMVRAGEHAGLSASDSEAFTALSMKQSEVKDESSLDTFAARQNISRAQLLGVVKEYLIAEQYRMLIMGHTFEMREDYSASPGLNRVRLENEVLISLEQYRQFLEPAQYQTWATRGVLESTLGRPRISDTALRHAVQEREAKISGTVVVLESEESTDAVTEAQLLDLFDKYKGDFEGQGETYGFGYRQAGRVRLEALRIPFDAVRDAAAAEITEADVRRYFDDNRFMYENWEPRDLEPEEEEGETEEGDGETEAGTEGDTANPEDADTGADPDAEGESPDASDADGGVIPDAELSETPGAPDPDGTLPEESSEDPAADAPTADGELNDAPGTEGEDEIDTEDAAPRVDERVRIDYRLRQEIRHVLVLRRAGEIQDDIIRDIQRMLSEDARVLDEFEGFKVIPTDFVPRPLSEVATRIQEDHGVLLEVVEDNGEWISLPEFEQTMSFVGAAVQLMPTRSLWPKANDGYSVRELRIPTVSLSGRVGLMSSGFQQMYQGQPRAFSLRYRIAAAKELQPEGLLGRPLQPQVGLVLPGYSMDATRSIYITRLTEAERDRPAVSLDEVRDDVERDARLLAGYEALLARRDTLMEQARAGSIFDIAIGGTDQQVEGFSRTSAPTIEGVRNTRLLVDAAFELAEDLRDNGDGVDDTLSADRLIVVELPRERKVLVFLISDYRPISRTAYQTLVSPTGRMLTELSLRPTIPEGMDLDGVIVDAISLEAMIRHTGFKYAEGEGPAPAEGAGDAAADDDTNE